MIGLSVLLLVPIAGWYAAVRMPTLSYKQGLRRGAGKLAAQVGFTSGGALVGAMLATFVVFWGVLIGGLAAAAPAEDNSTNGSPVRFTVPTTNYFATDAPGNFSRLDVLKLTQTQLGKSYVFPQGTKWVRCTSATFHSGNHLWTVSCEFYNNQDDTVAVTTQTYTFDDDSGILIQ
jgi:hypothetical protein